MWILIFLLILAISFAWAALSFAPWVPARKKDLKRIEKLTNFQSGEKFYELGCGNGRVLFYLLKKYDINAVGIELAFPLYLLSLLRSLGEPKAKIIFGDLFKNDLSKADVVYFFGMPDKIKEKLANKLKRELRPGTRVISYAFKVKGWEAVKVDKPEEKDIAIYLYIM